MRASVGRILEPWLLGPISAHTVEVGSGGHEGRLRGAGRGVVYCNMRKQIYCRKY